MIKLKEKEGKMILVKEPYEFVKGRYNLSILTLKVLSYLFTKIDPLNDKPFQKYEISVKEISEVLNKDYGNIYDYIKNTFRNLIDIKLEMEDNEEWKIFTIVIDPTILKRNGVISFYISPNLLDLLKRSKHYLKYDISILAYFNSSYALRLYKILKDKLETSLKYENCPCYDIEVKELKNLLNIPDKYLYGNIKQKVLNKALEEINTYSDIRVTFEEIKKGRKVEKIRFFIEKNDNNLLPNINNHDKKREKEKKKRENPTSSSNLLKSFREEIIQKFNNSDKYFLIEDKTFAIREDLLVVDDKPLKASEAITWWKYIYNNKDKIIEIDPEKEQKRAFEEYLEELKKVYLNKETYLYIKGEYKPVKVANIKASIEDPDNLEIYFIDDNKKMYSSTYSLEGFKTLFK